MCIRLPVLLNRTFIELLLKLRQGDRQHELSFRWQIILDDTDIFTVDLLVQ
jgi:hypothetical protein